MCVGTACTVAGLWKSRHTHKGFRFAAALAPLLALGCVTAGYKMLNYHCYGEYAITDRSGTYCKEVMSDLLQVAVPEFLWSLAWPPLVWLLFRAIYNRVGGTKLA